MALPLALPLAPVLAPGATAAATTFIAGSSLALAETVYGFRRNVPVLPPITGTEGLATLQEMIADAWAGARVPVANPVPPPFNPGGLGLAAAAGAGLFDLAKNGLSQVWGLLNHLKTALAPGTWEQAQKNGITFQTPTTGVVSITAEWGVTFTHCFYNEVQTNPVATSNQTLQFNNATKIEPIFSNAQGGTLPCGSTQIVPGASAYLRVTDANGNVANGASISLTSSNGMNPDWVEAYTRSAAISGVTVGGVNIAPPDALVNNGRSIEPSRYLGTENAVSPNGPAPLILPLLPGSLPNAQPLTQPTPENSPSKLPDTPWPLQPANRPGTSGPSTGTGTRTGTRTGAATISSAGAALPALPAYTPPLTRPAPAEPVTQTQTDGALVPTTAPPVVATDPGAVVPWPGAAAIPGTGLAPAPTLQGIAQEVGRIERKLEVMNTPNAPGNLIDKFDLLRDLIGPLVEAFLSSTSGTTYTMDSPCEVDAEGFKLPAVEVEAPGALTNFGLVLNRLDALAELLQVHKNLKQPNCRQKPPVGEFVTVNFEEIS